MMDFDKEAGEYYCTSIQVRFETDRDGIAQWRIQERL